MPGGFRKVPAGDSGTPPLWCPQGACLSPRLPTLPLVYFPAPYPPDPLPQWGRGSFKVILCKGLRPRHPCIKPFAALTVPAVQVPSGVAQAGGRLPTLPFRHPQGGLPFSSPAYPAFSLLSCPLSPRPPSPAGKGETISLFRRGLRPRHPCIKPFAALTIPAVQVPGGGAGGAVACRPCTSGTRRGACFLCRLPTLPLVYFPAPYPPSPLPRRGRGRIKVFLCKGLRPLHPRG